MRHISYKNDNLVCEEVLLKELAQEYGTPLYVYSKNEIVENYQLIDGSLGELNHLVCYSLKANSNIHILRTLAEKGAGAEVVSAGELYLALKAGFAPDKIIFGGVGKREDEIEYGLQQNVFAFSVESVCELQMISRIALRLNKKVHVLLRVNPNIDTQAHPYIATSLASSKFGIEASKSYEAFKIASTIPSVNVIGIHVHLGSQISKVEPYITAVNFITDLINKLTNENVTLTHVNIGGGFAVQYVNVITHEALPKEESQNNIPSVQDYFSAILPLLRSINCFVFVELGRSIIANAGVLITKVISIKENQNKKFIIVDCGMNDLLRPALYQSYHQIVPLTINTYEREKVDVVGPICENSDFIARDRILNRVNVGDYLAVLTTGAYGYVLASNYNSRLKPAEILVNGDRVRVIRRRQEFKDLE